jgi:hypothetical protein
VDSIADPVDEVALPPAAATGVNIRQASRFKRFSALLSVRCLSFVCSLVS